MSSHFKRWGVAYFLLVIFLVALFFQWFTMLELIHTQGYTEFWAAVFENWQSEFLQLLIQAVLVNSIVQRFWFNADDSAGKEDIARLEQKLDKILDQGQ